MSKIDEMLEGYNAPIAAVIVIDNTQYNKMYIENIYYNNLYTTFRHVEHNTMILRIYSGKRLLRKDRIKLRGLYKDDIKKQAYSHMALIYTGPKKGKKAPKPAPKPLHTKKEAIEINRYCEQYTRLSDQYCNTDNEILQTVLKGKIRALITKFGNKFGVELL